MINRIITAIERTGYEFLEKDLKDQTYDQRILKLIGSEKTRMGDLLDGSFESAIKQIQERIGGEVNNL